MKEKIGESDGPEVGIYYIIDGEVYKSSVPIKDAETYGNFKNSKDTHFNYFDLIRLRFPEKKLKNDYGLYPRGRINYNIIKDIYEVHSDPCLNNRECEMAVKEAFNLTELNTTFIYTTEDYRCPGCDSGIKEDFDLTPDNNNETINIGDKRMEGKEIFEKLVKEGLDKLGFKGEKRKEAKARIKYESGIIEENNEYEYYLILRDIVEFAKENGIMLGPGRGAATGSMICYVLGITKIDPIEYGLLSERFSRAEKLIYQRGEGNHFSSIPQYYSQDICIDIGYKGLEKIREYIKKITGKYMEEEVDSKEGEKDNNKGKLTIKVRVGESEKKIYFLSLGVLDLITGLMDEIKIQTGKSIDFEKIPLDDKNVFDKIGEGETEGVFQLQGRWAINICKTIKPKTIEALSNIIALNGPDKDKIIEKYLQGEEKKEEIVYVDESLRVDFREPVIKILEETNGVILYQEQIMKIFHIISGFGLPDIDSYIKKIRAKDEKFIKYMEGLFRFRAHTLYGVENVTVKNIWEMILCAIPNAFIKAHTIAYAMLAYKVAYLKYYYPEIFNKVYGERLKEKDTLCMKKC